MDKNTLLRCNNLRFRSRKRQLVGSISIDERGNLSLTQKVHPNGIEHVIRMNICNENEMEAFNRAYPDFEIVPRSPKFYDDFKVGDVISSMDNEEERYRIIFRSGDFVAYKAFREVEGKVSTVTSLRKGGYRLNLTTFEKEIIAAKASEFSYGDKVVMQAADLKEWGCGEFRGYDEKSSFPYKVKMAGVDEEPKNYLYCLPFNEENQKLIGTTEAHWKRGGSK